MMIQKDAKNSSSVDFISAKSRPHFKGAFEAFLEIGKGLRIVLTQLDFKYRLRRIQTMNLDKAYMQVIMGAVHKVCTNIKIITQAKYYTS